MSAAQIYGGAGLAFRAGFSMGRLAGLHLVLNGTSSIAENIARLLGDNEYTGFMEKGYILSAEFLGFDKKYGSMAYHTVDMISSIYGISALSLKPDARRIYRYIPSDYYRQISRMTKTSLALEFISSGNKLRIINNINKDVD